MAECRKGIPELCWRGLQTSKKSLLAVQDKGNCLFGTDHAGVEAFYINNTCCPSNTV
jgi:hypothetical protein